MTTKFCIAAVALLVLALCALLGPQWISVPDLSHGTFMPIVFLFLLREARSDPAYCTPPWLWIGRALLLAGLAGLSITGLYAAALEWNHPLVGFAAAGTLSLFLFGSLLTFGQLSARLIPVNWSSFLAATLWILCAPVPPGTYSRLTLSLQLWVSENVVRSLHLLGIPAVRHGNIIELARNTVGVEEACSGVRSLVSCVFAGLFFSGCLVRNPRSRAILIVASAPLAIGMNFLRSLTLTLLANSGVDISGRWHDLTGFAVLGLTALILAGAAILLSRREKVTTPEAEISSIARKHAPTGGFAFPAAVFAVAIGLGAFFALHSNFSGVQPDAKVPDLAAIIPAAAPGWLVKTSDDLNRFSSTLETDAFIQRTFARDTPNGVVQITAYIAYWKPGQASASLVATHTPDACWPGAGWQTVPVTPQRVGLKSDGRTLPESEYRLFRNDFGPQHVWYWHIYDGAPIRYVDPLSPRNLLEIAVKFGFRRAGAQAFVRISSNRPWSEIADDPLVIGILSRLRPLGL